jgi:hypothetical protein
MKVAKRIAATVALPGAAVVAMGLSGGTAAMASTSSHVPPAIHAVHPARANCGGCGCGWGWGWTPWYSPYVWGGGWGWYGSPYGNGGWNGGYPYGGYYGGYGYGGYHGFGGYHGYGHGPGGHGPGRW